MGLKNNFIYSQMNEQPQNEWATNLTKCKHKKFNLKKRGKIYRSKVFACPLFHRRLNSLQLLTCERARIRPIIICYPPIFQVIKPEVWCFYRTVIKQRHMNRTWHITINRNTLIGVINHPSAFQVYLYAVNDEACWTKGEYYWQQQQSPLWRHFWYGREFRWPAVTIGYCQKWLNLSVI